MSHAAQDWSYEQTIKAGPKSVLNALAWRADRATWRACPGVAQLSDDTGLDERSVRRNLDWLEENGLIARRRRHAENGRRKGERIADEFELNPSRKQPDNLPDTSEDKLSASRGETTGHFDGDYRTNLQGQPDILSSAYKDRTKIRTKSGTKIGDHDLLGDSISPKKAKKKSEANRPTPVPTDWPNDPLKIEACEHWLALKRHDLLDDLPNEIERARRYYLDRNEKRRNWDATWRTWFRNSPEFRRAHGGPSSTARRSSKPSQQTFSDHGEDLIEETLQ